MATGRVPTTANSPLTAKGDLFGYSTTQARVPVGNNGESLVADSSASTGLKWQADTVNTVIDAKGDLLAGTAADTLTRLPLGTTGQVLKVNTATSTGLEWAADSAGMTNPMTTTGDTIYSSSGSTPARLGIGSDGQILTVASGVPSWATPAGGGGMTAIASGSLSGSSVSLTSIPGTYNELLVVLNNVTLNANGLVGLQHNSITTSTYTVGGFWINPSTGPAFANFIGNSNFDLVVGRPNMNTGVAAWTVRYPNYTSTTNWKRIVLEGAWTSSSSSQQSPAFATGFQTTTNAITSIQIMTSQTFSTGTYTLYGVK